MIRKITTLLTFGMASAAPSLMYRQDAAAPEPRKLLIGTPFQVLTADFDGSSFAITGNNTVPASAPSWMAYKGPNLVYAVNENANDTTLFTLDENSANPTLKSSVNGSAGVVFLEFNADQTRMVGAGYGSGMIDVWKVAEDGSLTILKQFPVEGPIATGQTVHRPHQALLDPTGRFFVIPNLGGDTVLVLDSKDDKFEISTTVSQPEASGPRHGGFITSGESHYYVMATEISSEVVVFELEYADDTMVFTEKSRRSTYGDDFPPANVTSARAGELAVANNQQDVYISNRLSGHATDSIAHFTFNAATAQLTFSDTVSSGGRIPRMFSLGMDAEQSTIFVANQDGENGLVALQRCTDSGKLYPTPIATMPYASIVAPAAAATPSLGPYFVVEIC